MPRLYSYYNVLLGMAASLLSFSVQASEIGPIKSEEGFVDSQSGAKVEEVSTSFWTGKTKVLVTIPIDQDKPMPVVEEILVTAERVEAPERGEPVRYEFLKDFGNDRYGIYVYLGKRADVTFRIYFKDATAEILDNPLR